MPDLMKSILRSICVSVSCEWRGEARVCMRVSEEDWRDLSPLIFPNYMKMSWFLSDNCAPRAHLAKFINDVVGILPLYFHTPLSTDCVGGLFLIQGRANVDIKESVREKRKVSCE
jgi:hypothetical protein